LDKSLHVLFKTHYRRFVANAKCQLPNKFHINTNQNQLAYLFFFVRIMATKLRTPNAIK